MSWSTGPMSTSSSANPGSRAAAARPDAELIAELEASRLHPLWTRYREITPIAPEAADRAAVWRWSDIAPFAERAAREVPIEDIERRALIMVNPDFGGRTVTTANLIAAFTVLEPGDRAVPHRHTAAAIRFSTDAEGAATFVNGRRCEMGKGDLIVTPPMCWHGHVNESRRRTIWFDGANIPLINELGVNVFEPGRPEDARSWEEADEGEERLWAAAGLMSPAHAHEAPHTPKFRYPGAEMRAMLAAVPASPDGGRWVRYVNPLTAGAVMPALDCYALRLAKGAAGRARRTTWNAVCLAVSGEGRSEIGETGFDWVENDIFSIPRWSWARHRAIGGEADLLVVTDRVVQESLGVAREELE